MTYLYSFLFAGIICAIGQIIYEKTKLSPGHITSILVVFGVILGVFGLYDYLIEIFGGGATVLIMNFGNLLVKGGLEGLKEEGLIGIFLNLFKYCSLTLSYTIFISLIVGFLFKAKDR